MVFRLQVQLRGAAARFDLRPGENLVGSEPECDVCLAHPAVSRHHAVLLVVDGAVDVADLGSENGTRVDGRRLKDKVRVESGCSLRFGTVEASLIELADDDAAPAHLSGGDDAAPRTDRDEASHADRRSLATTASVGPLQVFSLVHLPRLVAGLEQTGSDEPARAARFAGEALGASLPCRWVEVASGEGVLYRADVSEDSTATGAKGDEPLERRAGSRSVRIGFGSSASRRLYAPLVEAVARLLDWHASSAGDAARADRADHADRSGEPPPLPEPATVDPELRGVYERAAQVADSDLHVLIEGASGTGKELLARYVHAASPQRDEPFLALNCAALPADLLEAELFGVEKGVATGVDARPGRFEQADGGILFLDEIGDMALPVQAKILRVLQEREVHRLGGVEARSARVRVISATHRDVDELRAGGHFRDDLFHRIADWRVRLPTLAERAVDIPNLAAHFLERETRRHGRSVRGISRAALRVLCRHPWPGNVRQLEREIAKAALFADGGLLDTHCLDPALVAAAPPRRSLREHLDAVERREIVLALEATGHDVPQAAEDLGLPASTLYRKIRVYGLDEDVPASAGEGRGT